jgi:hypothetical protein
MTGRFVQVKRLLIIGLVAALAGGGALAVAAGDPPIILEVKKNDLDKIKDILKNDPQAVRVRDHWDRSPLHWAARTGRVKAAAMLLTAGADANAVNKDGETPLHEAVFQGKMAMTVLLLAKGAKVNALSQSNTTALHYAVGLGNSDLARLLVARGADVGIRNRAGLTPLDLAKRAGKKALVKIMQAHAPAGPAVAMKPTPGTRVKTAPASPPVPTRPAKTAPAKPAPAPAKKAPAQPAATPAQPAAPVVKTTNPADLLPPGPMVFIAGRNLGPIWDLVEKSQWWSSVLTQLKADPKTAAILTSFEAKWKSRTGLEFNRKTVMGLVGGWLVLAVYPGPRDGLLVAAVQLGPDIDFQKLLSLWMKRKKKAQLVYMTIRGQKVGQVIGLKRPTYFYLTPERLLFLSPEKSMIESVIARVLGQAKDKFSAGTHYQALVREGLMKNQLGVALTMVPGTIEYLKRSRNEKDLEVFRALSRMIIVSNVVNWRLVMDFKPEAKKFLEKFKKFFVPARGPADQGLFSRSPLFYMGLSGIHLGRQLASILARTPKRLPKLVLFAKAMGHPDLKSLWESMGNQAALGVFGVAQGGLPLPQAVLAARFKNKKSAAGFVAGLFKALVARGVVPPSTIQTRKTAGGDVRSVIVPFVGPVGVVSIGASVLISNHLPFLSHALNKKPPAKAAPNWAAARKFMGQFQMVVFLDAARILGLLPEIYLRLGLSGRGPKLSDIASLIDLAGALRYLTLGARWDGRTRFEMILHVELKDHQVTKKMSAKILTGLAEALTGVLK